MKYMLLLGMLALFGGENGGTVTSLSVVPAEGRAEVVIGVAGEVTLKHFTLANPNKIVVDINGATLGLPVGDSYDGVARGGITNIRYSQFTKSVVRVVLVLDAPHQYTVDQKGGKVRIGVAGSTSFEAWNLNKNEPVAEPA